MKVLEEAKNKEGNVNLKIPLNNENASGNTGAVPVNANKNPTIPNNPSNNANAPNSANIEVSSKEKAS